MEQKFDADQRQAYHEAHSLPMMAKLKQWCETQTEIDGPVEPNSNLGRAMAYFIHHYEGLSALCRVPGAPIDNNEAERIIKLIVRGRNYVHHLIMRSVSQLVTRIVSQSSCPRVKTALDFA